MPLVGTWIEIRINREKIREYGESCPSWARGLKYIPDQFLPFQGRRAPRGHVD